MPEGEYPDNTTHLLADNTKDRDDENVIDLLDGWWEDPETTKDIESRLNCTAGVIAVIEGALKAMRSASNDEDAQKIFINLVQREINPRIRLALKSGAISIEKGEIELAKIGPDASDSDRWRTNTEDFSFLREGPAISVLTCVNIFLENLEKLRKTYKVDVEIISKPLSKTERFGHFVRRRVSLAAKEVANLGVKF